MKRQCNLCNSEDIEIIFSHPKDRAQVKGINFTPTSSDFGVFYKLARCKNCNILFSLLDNKAIDVKQLYSESKDDLYLSQAAQRNITYKKILSHIKSFLSDNSRLLDIGCSYGLFLKLARGEGLQVYGVELSKDACRYCRDTLGLNVYCGDVKDIDFPENYFDVITAIEIIEHMQSPNDFIFKIHKILKPGGVLYLVTPNIESFSAKLIGYRWWSYRRMHLYYFSKSTLYQFLERNGFLALSSRPYKKTFKIGYIIHQLNRAEYNKIFYCFLSWLSNLLRLKNLYITASFGDIAVTAKKS